METASEPLQTALRYHRAGQLRQAEQLYRQILALNPRDAAALHLLGLVAHQAGRHEAAIELISRATSIDGAQPDYHCNLGEAFRVSGRIAEARACYERALELDPALGPAHYNLGLLLHKTGDWTEAQRHYEQSTRLQPNHAETHYNLGNLLRAQARLPEAIVAFQAALRCRPDYVDALNNLGAALTDLKRFEEAAEYLRRSLALEKDSAETCFNLGNACQGQGKLVEAMACFREALRLRPDFAPSYSGLGSVMRQQGRIEDAIACFEHARRLKEDSSVARMHLAAIYRDRGLLDEAETCYQEVLECQGVDARMASHDALGIQRGRANALSGLGMLELIRGGLPKATDFFQQALQIAPAHTEARLGLGMARLGQGEWLAGWPDYEDYLQLKFGSRRKFEQPRWDGSPLEGRTILVHADFGFGDVLHFIRYCPLVQKRGGRVLHEVHAKLMPLLDQSGFGDLIALGSPLPEFDVQISLLSLPVVFQTTPDTIPADIPYLAADPRRVEHFAARLADWGGLKIGIHWQGNSAYSVDRYRSVPLECFAPLAGIQGVNLISLQKGAGSEQIGQVADRFIVHRLDGLDEGGGAFLDTAAVIKNLDLVITCDSAVGHLAGALAVKVWVALPTGSDWRWLRDRPDTPWYPTMRLFRQSQFGQWSDIFDRMTAELRKIASRSLAR
ncbi:MAG: tetratricopeptide repeat protein [Planctomycetia bacterium]|nr:tetratricopeptide repeat protein [Planctomycetia bacterium]